MRGILLGCIVHPMQARYSEKGFRSFGAEVTEGCEPPCACWRLDLGPLGEQLVLLTVDPSLRPLEISFLIKKKKKMSEIQLEHFIVKDFVHLFSSLTM